MKQSGEVINGFLVDIFNRFLKQEEKALVKMGNAELSIHEIHVIEAVVKAAKAGSNTMGSVAKALGITTGSLTVAVSVLVRKGYIYRSKEGPDKRSVLLYPTSTAFEVEKKHSDFHRQMSDVMTEHLDKKELDVMSKALNKITQFFAKNAEDDKNSPKNKKNN